MHDFALPTGSCKGCSDGFARSYGFLATILCQTRKRLDGGGLSAARNSTAGPALLAQLRDFPSIPGFGKIIPGSVEKIPGYPATVIRPQDIDFAVSFGGLPAILGRGGGNIPVIFPVARELGKLERTALPIADCGVVAGEGFEAPTLGL